MGVDGRRVGQERRKLLRCRKGLVESLKLGRDERPAREHGDQSLSILRRPADLDCPPGICERRVSSSMPRASPMRERDQRGGTRNSSRRRGSRRARSDLRRSRAPRPRWPLGVTEPQQSTARLANRHLRRPEPVFRASRLPRRARRLRARALTREPGGRDRGCGARAPPRASPRNGPARRFARDRRRRRRSRASTTWRALEVGQRARRELGEAESTRHLDTPPARRRTHLFRSSSASKREDSVEHPCFRRRGRCIAYELERLLDVLECRVASALLLKRLRQERVRLRRLLAIAGREQSLRAARSSDSVPRSSSLTVRARP